MSKTLHAAELGPGSATKPQAGGGRKRKKTMSPASSLAAATNNRSSLQPLLVGFGAGAALTLGVVAIRSRAGRGRSALYGAQPTVTGALFKVALFGLARFAAQRVIDTLAKKAALKIGRAWPG